MLQTEIDNQGVELQLWPSLLRLGDRIHVAFRAARLVGSMSAPRYQVSVLDARRQRVATLLHGFARPTAGVVCVEWDGRDDGGDYVPPGVYRVHVAGLGFPLRLEQVLHIIG